MIHRLYTIIAFVTDDVFKLILFVLGSIGAFLTPINGLLGFTGGLIAIDVLTGIWASKVRGEKLNSKKLQRSWAKVILYPMGIIISFYAGILIPEIPFLKGATFLLVVIEGKSFEENASDILGYSLMKYIRTFIMKGRKGLIEEISKNQKDKDGH